MFSPAGCFRKIDCPLNDECELPNCIFLHGQNTTRRRSLEVPDNQYDKQEQRNQAPSKRLKLSHNKDGSSDQHQHNSASCSVYKASKDIPSRQTKSTASARLAKSGRISPPPLKRAARPPTTSNSGSLPETPIKTAKESLNPRMMANAPAAHSNRSLYLKKLHEILSRLNNLPKKLEDTTNAKLTEDELVTMALDEEERIAKENPTVYANIIKLRMVTLSKMNVEQWNIERLQIESKAGASIKQSSGSLTDEKLYATGLKTSGEIQILSRLCADKRTLEKHKFVVSPPTAEAIHTAIEGTETAMGWEQCDRCKTRFQVFPDRKEDGSLTSGGRCTYHPGRVAYPDVKGSSTTKIFTCCNEPLGNSVGCDSADTHVFKVNDENRLAAILQFEETPDNAEPQQAVAFDCEMGYTVNGMELVRLTAVSWPEGNDLLDILVRPLGTVLDLNSRFSGVRPDDFVKAVPYDSSAASASGDGPLQIVNSPMEARKLFFKLISPSTPVIGHALENDFNAVRIVHPSVVDTVILYPHRSGLPMRPALKRLAKDILLRDIQGAAHDSKEDAKAAGDVVRVKVAKTWRAMEAKGWRFKDGKLMSPTTVLSALDDQIERQ